MGTPGRHHAVRRLLSYITIAAAVGSAFVVFGSSVAFAAELTVSSGSSFSIEEGRAASDQVVANFTDHPPQITRPSAPLATELTCDQLAQARYTTTIDWGDQSGTDSGTVVCGDGNFQVIGAHTYNDSGSFQISVTVTDTVDTQTATGTDTATATITDADLEYDGTDQKPAAGAASEGVPVTVGAAFFDNNTAFPQIEGLSKDPGISGTINWGDGSATQSVSAADPPGTCECFGDVWITGSHVYDANVGDATYTVTLTAKDDGGATASHTLAVNISDGKLTGGTLSKTFTATAGQSTSPVVASFTDAAASQAAVADFAATIKWGDNVTSAGTITKTESGAFDVSGSHSYASAGTRTLSITVTDEEGQTLTVSATATVGAAPVVLPLTGQPRAPVAPMSPFVALALALMGIAGGIGGIMSRRLAR